MQYRELSGFALAEVQVSEMGHATLFTHPHLIPCEKHGGHAGFYQPFIFCYVQFPRAAPTPCSPRFLPSCSYHEPSQAGLQPGYSAFPGSYQALPFPGPAALPVHVSRNEGGGTVALRVFSMLLTRNSFCTAAH